MERVGAGVLDGPEHPLQRIMKMKAGKAIDSTGRMSILALQHEAVLIEVDDVGAAKKSWAQP